MLSKNNIKLSLRLLCLILIFSTSSAFADIKLPQLISDHMVLQRDIKLKIWGWASPKEKISVDFNGKKGKAVTDADGNWSLELPAMKAGGPYTMILKGNNQITLSDIYIGDVWFASGQSNMVLPMERLKERYPDEVAHDNFPEIRNFFVPTSANVSTIAEDLPPGQWAPAVDENILKFGGTTYFFAKMLYQKYHVPIGIINSSVGGTPIEAWMSAEAFKEFPSYLEKIKNVRDTAYMNNLKKDAASYVPPKVVQPEPDKGISGPIKWTDPNYVPQNWHKFWMPGYWADQGVKDLHGTLYFRKEIEVPASMTGVPAKLFLGRIIDADSAFVNGEFVGNITYQYPPRRYNVRAGLLKPGKNIIVVKVTNTAGKGGFVPDKNYSLNANGQQIDLRGEWIYQVGQVQKPFNRNNSTRSYRPLIAQDEPTGLYNTMTAPAINYRIKGFLWYQGETNSGRPKEYGKLLPALIADWRSKWGQGDLPFIYAQLPNFMEVNYSPSESDWAQLRQSQLQALSIPNTGMSVGIDAGEWNDIHPLNKKDIGERLALWAEYLAYGAKDLVHSGPIYQSHTIEGNKIILSFNNTGSGLMVKGGGDLYYFAIAGADKQYVWAKAKINGDKVIVWNDDITNPMYVRYAWADNPEGANLYNKEGLPASPFETDN
ncbi:sialate O-acetylesterase [Albibacterium sp.]|uniref:sialate O-acetylesterase n=1 Tax=Albibacterium sp. TaxID=2952885 RepID=UPI002B9EE961|nr:sialate O-acetylesterase [Albibacterium sp.]HUH19034.1 sialate O-acetylesterase [Albibacterium sp.]